MTPGARIAVALATIGWTQRGLAGLLRIDKTQVRRWIAGTYQPPEAVLAWLERLSAFHRSNPAPGREEPPAGL